MMVRDDGAPWAAASRCARLLAGLVALTLMSSVPAQEGSRETAHPERPMGGLGFSLSIDLSNLFFGSPEHEPGEVLILWNDAAELRRGRRWMKQKYGVEPVQVDRLNALGLIMGQFRIGTPGEQEVRRQLRQDQPRWVVDLNTRSSLLADVPSSPALRAPRLYAFDQLGLDPVDANRHPGSIKLGVADTAFDLASQLRVGRLVVRSMLSPEDQPAPVDHGTAIALLIAGAPLANGFSGVARGMDLFWASTLRMVDGKPRSNTAIVTRAVNWMAEQGVTAINLSQGGPGDDVFKEVFARLVERPVLVVAAAGNSGPRAGPIYPAAYPGVLAVTAIDSAGGAYAQANQGPYIGLSAPGVDVWVPGTVSGPLAEQAPHGQYLSGTSFASALVAGSLAYADSDLWRLSNRDRMARLCAGARDLGVPGRDPVFGCGLLRVPTSSAPQVGKPTP